MKKIILGCIIGSQLVMLNCAVASDWLARPSTSSSVVAPKGERSYGGGANYCASLSLHVPGGVYSSPPIINHNSNNWIFGEEGKEYKIKITNSCPFRVLAVVSVDGLNVLNGERANFNQGGYVVNSGSSTIISGWRKSMDNVARFYFTYPENSYGSRVGKADNLGIIGAAIFAEKQPEYIAQAPGNENRFDSLEGAKESVKGEIRNMAKSQLSERMASAAPAPSLGTGHGRITSSKVTNVEFERENVNPNYIYTVRYESLNGLKRNNVPYPNLYRSNMGNYPKAFEVPHFTPDP